MSRYFLLSEALSSPMLFDFLVICLVLLSAGIACGWHLARRATERKRSKSEVEVVDDSGSEPQPAESLLLASLSHEIRTPLNGIAGMSNFLMQSKLDSDQHECVQTIQSCVDSLLALVNDVLDYSKLESGRLEMECIEFDLRSQLEEALDVFAVEAQARGVALLLDVPEEDPLRFRGDPYRLRQILLNFVSNAIKFTKRSGQVTVSAQLLDDGDGGAHVTLRVADTGEGIPEEKLSRLFQAFRQLDASTTREYGGTGLGLAISRGLAHRMGGEVGVQSKVGVGSEFWVELDLERQAVALETAEPVDFEQMRVLVVDPNGVSRGLIVRQLKAWNVDVITAATLAEAQARFETAPIRVAMFSSVLPQPELLSLTKEVLASAEEHSLSLCLIREKGIDSKTDTSLRRAFAHTLFTPLKQRHLLAVLRDAKAGTVAIGSGFSDSTPASSERKSKDSLGGTHFRRLVRILIVDDNPLNRRVAQKMLEKLGYISHQAVNGKEAVEAAARSPFDLILMDRQMPIMDGVEATRIIREREAGGRRTPIVALTADALESAREDCLAAGMDDFITKPVTGEDLAAKIMRWVNCTHA